MNEGYREAGYVETPEEEIPEPPIGEELPWWRIWGPWLLGGTALALGIYAATKNKKK